VKIIYLKDEIVISKILECMKKLWEYRSKNPITKDHTWITQLGQVHIIAT